MNAAIIFGILAVLMLTGMPISTAACGAPPTAYIQRPHTMALAMISTAMEQITTTMKGFGMPSVSPPPMVTTRSGMPRMVVWFSEIE